MQSRRHLLKTAGVTMAGIGAAGCFGDGAGTGTGTGTTATETEPPATATETPTDTGAEFSVSAAVAVAAEWTAMEARVYDTLALGLAGEWDRGVEVAQDIFARFEASSGEYSAHEMLESTSQEAYETFEEALGELADAGLGAEDAERTRTEAELAAEQLRNARRELVGERAAATLGLLAMGARAADGRWLGAAGKFEAAATVGADVYAAFEEAPVHEPLEEADHEAYENFEAALEAVEQRANAERTEAVTGEADAALTSAVEGAYAVAPAEAVAAAGHLAVMQSRGFDASVLAKLGGPGTGTAHAAALNGYRARANDAVWLVSAGQGDHAASVAQDTFAHFEGARAHEALEEADHEAYENFEAGLEDLQTAASNGDLDAAVEAAAAIDAALVAGQVALAGGDAAVMESAFFRIRLGDAAERYRRGEPEVAAGITESLFERFERDEAGFHEAFEDHDHQAYETFEEHLGSLATAFRDGDDAAVEQHLSGTREALSGYETGTASTAVAASAEAGVMAGRVFDANVLATLGAADRAAAVVARTFERFERDVAGFHEALEEADHETYESFEAALGAAETGEYEPVKAFYGEAVAAAYAVVGAAGGSYTAAAGTLVQTVFQTFENAAVHETLEEADHEAYESFEAQLNGLAEASAAGSGTAEAAAAFADAALRGQFAVVGAVGEAPVDSSGGEGDESTALSGGPNVVDGVPDDADHVVEMQAVSFAPETLSVAAGETVAFKHVGGEPHSVTAREDGIPAAADYWASGGFDSQSAAEEGWENGEGAVQSGQSFVHTFETTGEHAYYCIPHAGAGMEGTVVVE